MNLSSVVIFKIFLVLETSGSSSEKSKFLGAIDLVVKEGFASTMELQLVSLDVCVMCRALRTLRVSIAKSSPIGVRRIVQKRGQPQAGRVPGILAYAISWKMPSTPKNATFPDGLCELLTNRSIGRVNLPDSILKISFVGRYNQSFADVVWPKSVRRLSFGQTFNQPIAGCAWPVSLQQLSFGNFFNKPVAGCVWPVPLQQLSFGRCFDQPIDGCVWPVSLQQMSFGENFNQPIAGCAWPASLQQLSFGRCFNQPIAGCVSTTVVVRKIYDWWQQCLLG